MLPQVPDRDRGFAGRPPVRGARGKAAKGRVHRRFPSAGSMDGMSATTEHSVPPTGTDNGTEGRYDGGHCLLGGDDGASWRTGYVDTPGDGYVSPDETTAAQLPDGRLHFNTRTDSTAPGVRADAYSADGGRRFVRRFRPQAGLTGPVVQGSLLSLEGPDLLLYSGLADPAARALMTVRRSRDAGVTRQSAHTVDGLPAAYSDLVRIDDDTVGLLYETGDFSAYETITFRRIPVALLS
ncbi:exo-alpha-sialidase [Streptomyces sp. VRA16 Mangrove soil]|nr:exo-alpha-sialidase [Streptomyces sp. VRA16 Mangrove soil]